jgi:hypothetical protein
MSQPGERRILRLDADRWKSRVRDRKNQREQWRAKRHWQRSDLTDHDEVIGARYTLGWPGDDKSFARRDNDTRRPATPQRCEHASAQHLKSEKNAQPESIHGMRKPKKNPRARGSARLLSRRRTNDAWTSCAGTLVATRFRKTDVIMQ